MIPGYVFILYVPLHTDLSPKQGEPCIGMVYHLTLKNQITDTFYRKTLRRPIQGVPGFGGPKSVENVPEISNTGCFRFLCGGHSINNLPFLIC